MKTVEEYGRDNEIRSEKLFMQMLLQNVDIVKKGVAGSSISCNTFHTNTNENRKSSELYWPLPYFCQKKFLCRARCLHKNGRVIAAVQINWNQ